MGTLASIVDTKALWQSIVSALVAGIGVTAIFCVVIYGGARFTDMNRNGRPAAAVTFGIVALVALAAFAAAIVIGIIVMTTK
jgi:hypothetical protein